MSDVNLTPSSTGFGSFTLTSVGMAVVPNRLHGPVAACTLTVTPAVGVCMLRLSSVARDLMTVDPGVVGRHE